MAEEVKETEGTSVKIKSNGGNVGLPFGLCKKYGIRLPEGATPRDAWDALKGVLGISPDQVYKVLGEKGKMPDKMPEKKAETVPVAGDAPDQEGNAKPRELDRSLIERANGNSMSGKRGDISEREYKAYVEEIMAMEISGDKKQKILDKLYALHSKRLSYEADHVTWAVAGPANYNAKRLDKSDKILTAGKEESEYMNSIRQSVEQSKKQYAVDPNAGKREIEWFERQLSDGMLDEYKGGSLYSKGERTGRLDPTRVSKALGPIGIKAPEKFVELWEKYDKDLHFRKGTNAYKLYESIKAGAYQGEKKPEQKFSDENIDVYNKDIKAGNRMFLKFTTRPKPQVIYAMKSRGWKWNANENAWSIAPAKYDEDFVKGISEKYAKYL